MPFEQQDATTDQGSHHKASYDGHNIAQANEDLARQDNGSEDEHGYRRDLGQVREDSRERTPVPLVQKQGRASI